MNTKRQTLVELHDAGQRRDIGMTIEGLTEKDVPGAVQGILDEISKLATDHEKSHYINLLSKRTGIDKRDLRRGLTIERKLENIQTSFSANIPHLLDICLDEAGHVVYLVLEDGQLVQRYDREINGTLFVPPQGTNLPFLLPRANKVMEHYGAGVDEGLFADVLTYLKRFAYQEERYWLLIALKIFLTYLYDHRDISYMPMILFYASPERGKSRTGKAMITIAYRGVHVVDLREANLFRFSQDLNATIFFDLMHFWKKAERNVSEDVVLLRAEKGAKVPRVLYPEKGAFEDTKWFAVYGSTIIATNEPLHNIANTRCINIAVPNRPGDYENSTPEMGLELKERLTAWRARMIEVPLPKAVAIDGIQGRLWDIARPILEVCLQIAPEHFDAVKGVLLEIAGQRVEDKKQSNEGRIASIIEELFPPDADEYTIKTKDVLEQFNSDRPAYPKNPPWIGKKLKGMGIRTRHIGGYSEFILTRQELNVLLAEFKTPEVTSDVNNGHHIPYAADLWA